MDIKTLIAVATGKIPHNYRSGLCPDELQPDSRDPDCPACKILIEAATEHDAMEHRLREAEGRVTAPVRLTDREPVAWMNEKNGFICKDPKNADFCVPLYVAPPVTAQAEGYVTALRYIAWEAGGYMDCVHAAKRAIGETGALPLSPKTQPARGEG